MKTAKNQSTQAGPIIAQAQWDFSKCSKEETEACFLYEYARECGDVIADVAFHSHRIPKDKNGKDLPGYPSPPPPKRSDSEFKALCLDLSCLWFLTDYFPNQPWLEVPEKERKAFLATSGYRLKYRDPSTLIEFSRRYKRSGYSRLNPTVDELYWDAGKGFRPVIIQGRKHGFYVIQVDFSLHDKTLKSEFALWLKGLDRSNTKVNETRGRTSAKERLTFLSAYRLLKHFSPEKAAQHTEKFLKDRDDAPRPLYSDVSSWYNARDKAKAILEKEFFQVSLS